MSEKELEHCGCGHEGCEHEDCDCCGEAEVVELLDDAGRKMSFYHLGTIEYKDKFYAAFQAAEEFEGLDEDELVIFEVEDAGEEESSLLPIEDEALLDEVYEEFCRVMEEDDLAEEAMELEPDGEEE